MAGASRQRARLLGRRSPSVSDTLSVRRLPRVLERPARCLAAIDSFCHHPPGFLSRASPLEGRALETLVGIALIVISAIEIIGIVRVVSANLNLGR
jgi:hypothetical protein